MKTTMILLLLVSVIVSSSASAQTLRRAIVPSAKRDPTFVTLAEIEKLPASRRIHIVDVRETPEYQQEKVKSTRRVIHHPLTDLVKKGGYRNLLKSIPKNETIVFICANGDRAKLARDHAAKLGYDAKFASLYKF